METFARVKRIEGAHALVEIDAAAGGCGRCDEPGGCRSSMLSHLFHQPCREFELPNDIGAREGDRVVVRLGEGGLARWAALGYLIPLATTFLGALAGDFASARFSGSASDELGAALGAAVGLLVGGVFALRLASRRAGSARPRLAWPNMQRNNEGGYELP